MNKKRNWFSPPGATILDMMEEQGLTEAVLADRMDIAENKLVALIKGEAKIDLVLATILARELGGSAKFWLQRQFNADHRSTTPELEFTYRTAKKDSTTGTVLYTLSLYLDGKRIYLTDACQTEEEATRIIGRYICAIGEAVNKAL